MTATSAMTCPAPVPASNPFSPFGDGSGRAREPVPARRPPLIVVMPHQEVIAKLEPIFAILPCLPHFRLNASSDLLNDVDGCSEMIAMAFHFLDDPCRVWSRHVAHAPPSGAGPKPAPQPLFRPPFRSAVCSRQQVRPGLEPCHHGGRCGNRSKTMGPALIGEGGLSSKRSSQGEQIGGSGESCARRSRIFKSERWHTGAGGGGRTRTRLPTWRKLRPDFSL